MKKFSRQQSQWPTRLRIISFIIGLLIIITGIVIWVFVNQDFLSALLGKIITGVGIILTTLQFLPIIFSHKSPELVPATGPNPQHQSDNIAVNNLLSEKQSSQPSIILPTHVRRPPTPANPYKGLNAFTEDDACYFFGRDKLIDDLVKATETALSPKPKDEQQTRLLAVVGPSGSGKSSIVRAGLIPRLKEGKDFYDKHDLYLNEDFHSKEWVFLDPIFPGTHPVENLAISLAKQFPGRGPNSVLNDLREDSRSLHILAKQLVYPSDRKVVLVVDQFEEVFRLTTSEEERQKFFDLLITAIIEPAGPLFLILTLRIDFYPQVVHYDKLYQLIDKFHISVLPLTKRDDLRKVIEQPANLQNVQLTFENGLVDEILFDMQRQSGALPLLEFLLDQLYRRRDRPDSFLLTRQAYREMGDFKGALERHADRTYEELPSDEHRQMAHDMFLRLIRPGSTEQEDSIRRRVPLNELEQADPVKAQKMQETLERFTSARLLTKNQVDGIATIEVSHEMLIREWKLLTTWVRESRDDILFQESLSEDVGEWERQGRPRTLLYWGKLKRAQAWAKRNNPSEQEVTFLRASATQRTLSLVSLLVAMLLLVSSIGFAGWYFFFQPSKTLVTTLKDNNGVGSLRWCIVNAPLGSTITFDRSVRGIIELTEGDLLFSGDKHLTIEGPGANQLAITGGNRNVIIHISKGATLDFSGLSFKNSLTTDHAFLFNEGTLKLTRSIISNNKANGFSIQAGGGIENKGALTVIDSTISNNTSINTLAGFASMGGGIYNDGQLIVSNSLISNNSSHATVGFGGGIVNKGTAEVTNSIFSNNIVSDDTSTTNVIGYTMGGGIANSGRMTVTNSTFSNNQAIGINAMGRGGGIANSNSGILMVTNSTFSGNTAKGTVVNSEGGGIDNLGKLIVTNSKFLNNLSISGSGIGFAGGIANANSGILMVTNSTFSENIAKSDKQISRGGGMYNAGKLTVANSMFSNNKADSSSVKSFGGGIFFYRGNEGSYAIIRFCTIYENSSYGGGGIWVDPAVNSYMRISSNIIAHNSANEGPDIFGTVISEGYNLIENVNGAKGLNAKTDRQVNLAELKIEPTLDNHGGPTQTLALLPGSQAIDTVPLQECSISITDVSGHMVTISTDQRGERRPDGSEEMCDIGAYESSY